MIINVGKRTSEGFCPVPLLGCDECWDQQVELPGGETSLGVKRLSISSLSVCAVVAGFPPWGKL